MAFAGQAFVFFVFLSDMCLGSVARILLLQGKMGKKIRILRVIGCLNEESHGGEHDRLSKQIQCRVKSLV